MTRGHLLVVVQGVGGKLMTMGGDVAGYYTAVADAPDFHVWRSTSEHLLSTTEPMRADKQGRIKAHQRLAILARPGTAPCTIPDCATCADQREHQP